MTTAKKLIIPLTGRKPVSIDTSEWPVIAGADTWSGEHECQANRIARIRVRQHADGRTLVYGHRGDGPGGNYFDDAEWSGGKLLLAGEDIAAAIEELRDGLDGSPYGGLGIDALICKAIADLPPEEL